jgi:hypothetical protein
MLIVDTISGPNSPIAQEDASSISAYTNIMHGRLFVLGLDVFTKKSIHTYHSRFIPKE